ncbi:hypothetical protein HMPREF9141_1131 [Prevotella multiformis DSM 16608]|uniref:Uncharacterized protein n=1 Tax=Prevotella multiformis DSM 16608 TaxID=888743 RepID=F0F6A9_9BACT|nr:hypothetical protein HMPREF9141_1131 [Prevotella multiformis DSM 16608]
MTMPQLPRPRTLELATPRDIAMFIDENFRKQLSYLEDFDEFCVKVVYMLV